MINNKVLLKHFSKKWKLEEGQVQTIFSMVEQSGRKYGKTSRILKSFGVMLSSRQVKYFYRRVMLTQRFGDSVKIGSSNYRKVVLRKS